MYIVLNKRSWLHWASFYGRIWTRKKDEGLSFSCQIGDKYENFFQNWVEKQEIGFLWQAPKYLMNHHNHPKVIPGTTAIPDLSVIIFTLIVHTTHASIGILFIALRTTTRELGEGGWLWRVEQWVELLEAGIAWLAFCPDQITSYVDLCIQYTRRGTYVELFWIVTMTDSKWGFHSGWFSKLDGHQGCSDL